MAEAEKKEVEQEELDFEIEGEEQEVELKVEDDTPEADRNRSPMPKEIVEAMIQTPINVPDSPYFSFEVSDDMINEMRE